MKKIVLVTGGFDPIHSGHIAYFKEAKKLGDVLVVGVNSDAWLTRKKGTPFMPYHERAEIVGNIVGVDRVIDFNDDDGSAKNAIDIVRTHYPQDKIIFANGGDRTHLDIPEMDIQDDNLQFVFGAGGFNKANSSSWILREWKSPKTQRPWGYYRILHDVPGCKVKELTVNPGKRLSMQKHNLRSEYWLVSEGCGIVNRWSEEMELPPVLLNKHDEYCVPVEEWHQLTNPTDKDLRVVEIQYGENCIEEDIERK